MFPYTDPTGTDLLERLGALDFWRQVLHASYVDFARQPRSGFTLLDAFSDLSNGAEAQTATVRWTAFPRTAQASFEEIDADRSLQDEYCEWRAERDGRLARVTFSTEFRDWYGVLAAVGFDAVAAAIRELIPDAEPTVEELYGPDFDPEGATPGTLFNRYLRNRLQNPWDNGERGILSLSLGVNSIGALFALVGECAVARPELDPDAVCSNVGGNCVPGRNSDPFICSATQTTVRGGNAVTLADPAGIRIEELQGSWTIDGEPVDPNDLENNRGLWTLSRNRRRGVLDLTVGDVTLDDRVLTTGAQVATRLLVGADVLFASEQDLPEWARTGNEDSREIQ